MKDEMKDEISRLREALTKIAEHPHNSYDHPTNQCTTGSNYGIGCADGHRCAAQVARGALDQIGSVSVSSQAERAVPPGRSAAQE